MRKLFLVALISLVLPVLAQAQEAPRFEIFGGYSYLRTDADFNTDQDLNGFNAGFTANLASWVGIAFDISSHYGNTNLIGGSADFNTFMIASGPRFYLRRFERVTPFAHALIGGNRTAIDVRSIGINAPNIADTSFAFIVGGGVDLNVTDKLAVRLFQTDFVLTRFADINQNNFRTSTGLVLKLGEQ
jgi:opacity protein-like surface antigen